MPDQFTKVTRTGFFSRLMSSVGGIFIGFILFIASFGLLFWNEGRTDLSTVAKKATEVSSEQVNADAVGKFISTTGTVSSTEKVGDGLFLQPDTYIAVKRSVEMYAWVEEQEKKTTQNVGGSETTETKYTYTKKWTSSPASSNSFEHPEGHENPTPTVEDATVYASTASVGAYSFNPSDAGLPSFTDVTLTDTNTTGNSGSVRANGTYVFIPSLSGSTMSAPTIGDMRASYSVLRPGFNGTLFGELSSDGVVSSYTDDHGNSLYRVFDGTRNESIATLHSEHTTMTWILRVVGFMMMWMGLAALFGPISVFLDILPFLGSLSRFLVGGVTFLVAAVLSVITIVLSMILHNIIALLITAVIVVGGVMYAVKRIKARGPKPVAPAV